MAVRTIITAAELERLPEDDNRYELVRGELIAMPPAGGPHGEVAAEIIFLLKRYVHAKPQAGRVYTSETGFVLASDPDTMLAPDAAFVSSGRIPPTGLPEGFVPLAPDLAVEVLSPHDSLERIEAKVREYLTAGTRLVWIISPRNRTLTAYQSLQNIRVFTEGEVFDAADVLPEFSCRVTDIFPR